MNREKGIKKRGIGELPPSFSLLLAEVCRLDTRLNSAELERCSQQLQSAGYTEGDIRAFASWFAANDWRGRKGERPTLDLMLKVIKQSREAKSDDDDDEPMLRLE